MADNSRLETDGVHEDNVETETCILDSCKTDRKLYLSFLVVPSRALRLFVISSPSGLDIVPGTRTDIRPLQTTQGNSVKICI